MKKSILFSTFIAGFATAAVVFTLVGNGVFQFTGNKVADKISGITSPAAGIQPRIAASYGTKNTAKLQGESMTWSQFTAARDAFSATNPGAVRGGSMGKGEMTDLMNAIPTGGNMAFYFGKDTEGKMFVMFLPAAPAENTQRAAIYKNNSFCPTVCN